MWLDAQGVVHTVAIPDAAAVGDDVRAIVSGLDPAKKEELRLDLEALQDHYFDLVEAGEIQAASNEVNFEAKSLPFMVTEIGDLQGTAGLITYLQACEDRWRLDAVQAVQDYVDLVSQ